MNSIHKTAVVSETARLGNNVKIGAMAFIDDNVELGDNVEIGPSAVVLRYTTVGRDSKIHSHAVVGDTPQDMAFENKESFTHIGERCVIREGVTIHRGTKPGTATEIGSDCYLMCNSHCAHNVKLGNNVILVNGSLLAGYVEVGDRAFISGNCLIHQFVRIGKLAMLSGSSGVSKDVPPFCTTKGVAANTVAGLNVVGMRRAGIKPDERLRIKQCYRLLYRSGLNTRDAVAKMKEMELSPLMSEFCLFVEESKRGVCAFDMGMNDAGREGD